MEESLEHVCVSERFYFFIKLDWWQVEKTSMLNVWFP
jgi:hypothetical protein